MAIFNKNKKEENNKAPETNAASPAENVAADPKPAAGNFDFNRYFLAERRIFLENVSYETTPKPGETSGQNLKLGAKDTIVAQMVGTVGVKVTYNRELKFDPEGPFVLSVSYAVMLFFNPGTKDEVDWKTIDIAKEFPKNCGNLIGTMMSRSSLLIAEIPSAAGQPPVIMGMPVMKQQ